MGVEQSKAAALAAFRAGRVAGQREALATLVDMIDNSPTHNQKLILMDACERISALNKDETNLKNLPRDPAAEEAAEKETANG